MAITSPQGIDLQAQEPLELKTVKQTVADMLAISRATRYEGLRVYVIDSQQNWQLQGGIEDIHWALDSTAAGHVIQDDGVAFQNRSNLNFVGNFEVTDDFPNDTTIVEFNESDPVFSAWEAATDYATIADIPTALSDLAEDTTHRVITDVERDYWNNKVDIELDPLFTSWEAATDYALISDIPTQLAQLAEDTTHRLVTDADKSNWNSKLSFENDPVFNAWLVNTPPAYVSNIPTQLSQLAEDSTHRLTSDIEKTYWNDKADIADIPTQLAQLASDSTHRTVTDAEKAIWNAGGGGGGGGHVIQNEGVVLPSRSSLNFVGAAVDATDDSGSNSTVVTITETDPLSLHLDQTTPQTITNGVPLLENTRVISSDHQLIDKKYADTLSNSALPKQAIVDTLGITGFVDGDNIDIAYNYTNRTITLTGDLRYYFRGTLYTLTSPWTSVAHTATVGRWFLFCTDGTNFTWSNSVWAFKDVMVASIKYGATAAESFGIRETHKTMDSEAHKELHNQIGTYKSSGGILTAGTYAENVADEASVTPGFDTAVLEDEDLQSTVLSWPQGTYTTVYVGPGNALVFDTTKSRPFHDTGANTYMQINDPVAGTMSVGTAGDWYNVYQVIVPACSDSDSQKYRMIMLQPQVKYNSLAAAQGEDPRSLKLGDFSTSFTEYVIHARITYKTQSGFSNAGRCRIETGGVTYLAGNKQGQISVAGFTTNNHASLSNREWQASQHYSGLTVPKLAAFDASGLPVYADNPIPYFDATIGSGGDYADIAAAQTAGKYRLKAVGNITMSGDTAISNNIYLDLNGYTMNCTIYKFTLATKLIINCSLNKGIITFTFSVAGQLFSGSSVYLYNITITNNSTTNLCFIAQSAICNNIIVNLPNYSSCGFGKPAFDAVGIYYNIAFVGGGTSCNRAIYQSNPTSVEIKNINLTGTWNTSGEALYIVYTPDVAIEKITYSGTNATKMLLCNTSVIKDANNRLTVELVSGYLKNAQINNLILRTNTISENNTITSACTITAFGTAATFTCKNTRFLSNLIITTTGGGLIFSENYIAGTTNITADYVKFLKNVCTGLVTLASGTEYCDISHNTLTGGLTNSSGNTTNIITSNI